MMQLFLNVEKNAENQCRNLSINLFICYLIAGLYLNKLLSNVSTWVPYLGALVLLRCEEARAGLCDIGQQSGRLHAVNLLKLLTLTVNRKAKEKEEL